MPMSPAMLPQMMPTAGGMQQMMPFISPDQIAQNQADMAQWQQRQQMAQALMNTQIPAGGRATGIAGIFSKVLGAIQNNRNNDRLSDLLKQQFQIENQAAQAKRQQDLADEYRKMQEEIYKGQMTEKAKRDYAKREVVGGMLVDPTDPNASQAIPGYTQQQVDLERQKAQIAAQYREAPGAAGSAKLAQIQKIMAMPDSPTKTAMLSSLVGEGGMQAMAFGSMMGGGQGGAVGGAPTGDEFLKTLNPAMANQIKAIAEGRQAPPTSMAMRSPMGQALMAGVAQYDPSFDATNYAARSKTRNAFTAGKEGQTINAINTAIGHAGSLMDAADALDNTSFPLVNQGLNAFRSATGDPRVQQFNVARDALAGEITKAFRGSSGSEKDIQEIQQNLSSASSPDQLRAAVQQATHLLGSKVSSLGNQYQAAFGANSQPNLLDPKAQAVLKKLSSKGIDLGELGTDEGVSSGAPAAQAAPTATATGPNGQKIGLINGQWVPL